MKLNLFDLLQVSMSDPDSPNILLTVHLSDLHQLVVDTIEATRERILPVYMDAEKERPLTRKEVAELLSQLTGTEIDKKKVELPSAIKEFGSYDASVRLYAGIVADFKLKVEEL